MYGQYIIYVVLTYSAALAMAALSVYVWRRRTTAPVATPFAWTLALVGLWSLMDGIWTIVPSQAIALICYKLAYIGVAFVPVDWIIFALQ